MAPASPPCRIPFLSLAPNIIFLKVSVVDNSPIPAPNTALPAIPNGPKNKALKVAAPILGNALLTLFLKSLENKPDLLSSSPPNKNLLADSLFFT